LEFTSVNFEIAKGKTGVISGHAPQSVQPNLVDRILAASAGTGQSETARRFDAVPKHNIIKVCFTATTNGIALIQHNETPANKTGCDK